MGAGNATFSHGKEQAIIKDQITLSNSAMKSPASPRKNLHVSFTEADMDKVGRDCDSRKNQRQSNVGGYPVSQNVASDYESNEGHSHSSRPDYSRNHTNSYCSTRHSGEDGKDTRESHTSTYYVPTHLPPSHNNANNNYHPNLAYRLSRYDNVDDFAAQKSSMNNQRISPSPRPRSRSASPRRMERMLVANSVKDIKDLTAVLQSDRSSSVSTRKAASISSDSSGIQGDKMTAFSIGRPAKFSPGVYGDLGIFKSISQVNEHLYICGVMALSEEKIKALKIDCVINATLDWPPYQIRGLETMRIQVDDVPSASLSPHFDRVANKVNEVITRGGRVLVHCMAGISRSSTLCIAYLMKYRGFSLQQAYSLMKTKRPLIRPNDGFWRQLVQYEKELKRHKMQKPIGAGTTETINRGTSRAAYRREDNPSMTVTRLASAQREAASSALKSSRSVTNEVRASAAGIKHDDKHGYPNLGLPTSTRITPLARSMSNHRLGTLRNSGVAGSRLNSTNQREIALAALRSGDHWSTTYANDYSKGLGARR